MKPTVKTAGLFGLAVVYTVALGVTAQEAPDQEAVPQEGGAGPDGAETGSLDSRLQALEAEIAKLKEREQSQQADKAENEELQGVIEELRLKVQGLEETQQLEELGDSMDGESHLRPLSIYGFFNLAFAKGFSEEGDLYRAFNEGSSSFVVYNANLYFKSEMTESLSALMELAFKFAPHGTETSYEIPGLGIEYTRVDNTATDPMTSEQYLLGGVGIERIHLTYSPVDWFGVLAGRYLTPYGIWNVDHSPTVITTTHTPYMQIRSMVPRAQTGLQIFGRLFPSDNWIFDYIATVSNGRGPIESVKDLDDNKGLGLKLKLTYMGNNVTITAGSYGYFGAYTDKKKVVTTVLNEDLTLDTDADSPLTMAIVTTEEYDEYLVASDLMIELFGIKLQSEFVWRYVDINVPGRRNTDQTLVSGAAATEELYTASYIGKGVYGLILWDLPVWERLNGVHIIPYFMYEYNANDDTSPNWNMDLVVIGLNVKPSPYVTLKAQYTRLLPEYRFMKPVTIISAQLAVSF